MSFVTRALVVVCGLPNFNYSFDFVIIMFIFYFDFLATTANDLRLRMMFYPRLYALHLFSYLNS